jgi:hypothetical protein
MSDMSDNHAYEDIDELAKRLGVTCDTCIHCVNHGDAMYCEHFSKIESTSDHGWCWHWGTAMTQQDA